MTLTHVNAHAIRRYAFAEFLEAAKAASPGAYSANWCGGLTRPQTLHAAEYGDDGNVRPARQMLEQVQGGIETPRRRYRPAVAGGFAVVPEYLAGVPECMRRRQVLKDASNPITIYASIMASAFVDADSMMKRGIAILAAVLKLQAIRPISLYAVCPWVDTSLVIEIPTKPLSIAHAAFVLSHPAFFRRLGHEVLHATGDYNTGIENDQIVPRRLGLKPSDLFMGTGVSTVGFNGAILSKYQTILSNPVGWINETIQACAKVQR